MGEIVFVLTDHGEHGVGITSPQLPGLVAGVPSFEDVTPTYLLQLVQESAAGADGFVVFVEELVERDGRVFAVRCRQDFFMGERVAIAQALVRTLEDRAVESEEWPVDSLGDTVLVAALGTDRVGDLARTVADGEPVFAVVQTAGGALALGIQAPAPSDRDVTVAELIERSAGAAGDAARELALTR